jgi:hypothetical protein
MGIISGAGDGIIRSYGHFKSRVMASPVPKNTFFLGTSVDMTRPLK